MKPIIYVDVLFLVNLIVNYILLMTTAKIGRLPVKGIRITVASVLSALYAVFLFFPDLSFIYSISAKLLFSCFIVAVAYNIKGVRLYFKALGIFYLATFSFGGGVFALCCFTKVGAAVGAVMSNGIFYMNLPWQILFISVFVSYFIIKIVWNSLKSKMNKENMFVSISIFLNDTRADINALVDTGNTLYDPITNNPVIIAEYDKLKPVLPDKVKTVFEKGEELCGETLYDAARESNLKIRLIPYSSLGKENGMLVGFKPDKIHLYENEQIKEIKNIIVGIYSKQLAKDKSYCALLHPEIIA